MDRLALMFGTLFAVILAEVVARRIGVASAVLMTLSGRPGPIRRAADQAVRDARMAATVTRIRADVVAAGRREAPAARREPGMPPDPFDRVTRRLGLGSAR
ncbi:hypothetical protein [Nocardia brevicatena]|uniref:hypothetical protein n=1 Tax=Nocardia brevicatena TaxID=37327 RepID=UPI0002E87665|nr:hypothetical protein [Nocardia brevicatena]